MEVIKVSPGGYCYGVVDALQVVRQAIKDPHVPRPVHILGQIIHNRHAVKEFTASGVITLDGPDHVTREVIRYLEAYDSHAVQTYEILRALELCQRGVTFVSCPSCGRVEIDVLAIASEVEKSLSKVQTPIPVAVRGCVVNGPGESRDADVGLAGGRGKGVIYRKGQVVKTVPESDFLEGVLKEIASLLPPREARLVYPGDGSPGPVSLGRTRKSGIHQSIDQRSRVASIGDTGGLRGVPLPVLPQREVP